MSDTVTPEELARQLDQTQQQLEAVQRISAALYSAPDLETLQRQGLETAMDVVGADAGSLLIYDAAKNTLVFRHAVGPVADVLLGTTIDLSVGLGIAGQVFKTAEPRITHDVERDADHIGTIDRRTGYQTHSLMTVPLRTRTGPPVGVVQLVNKRVGEFDQNDIAVTEVMGSLVTMAVQNAVLTRDARLAAVARSVGEISHDIGNMLTSVLPYVQTLEGYILDVRAGKQGAVDELESFYREVVENVADGVSQVEERTKEIARAIKGEVAPMAFEPGHPYRAAQRVVRSLTGAAGQRGVTLTVTGDETLEAVYDRARLYNALYNLVNNALPETPPGGSVTLSIAADDDPHFYTASVSDTGNGMPEEVRAKLFTDAAVSTKPGGTGLGTRIVQRIVEQHGGTARVLSAPGQGTTIILRLPKQPPSV